MARLAQMLRAIPPERIAICEAEEVRFAQLQELGENPNVSLHGRNVVLLTRSVTEAMRAIVQVDGVVHRLFLASPSLPHSTVLSLAERAQCNILLSDDDEFELPSDFERIPLASLARPGTSSEAGSQPIIETQWSLSTSGTTGEPKLVGHTLESLTRTTKTNCIPEGKVRWALLYDYTRYAGLQVLLQSVVSGATIVVPDPSDNLAAQLEVLSSARCTHLSGTPTMWRKLLMQGHCASLPLEQVTLGGEIADQRILSALKETFPNARITHIYASTEAGVCFSVTDGREGFPASYLEDPPSGVQLQVREGRLYVSSSRKISTYVGTDETFSDDKGFVDTGDIVSRIDDRYVFMGRANGIINVGGSKVHPERVERVLLEHPTVSQCRVYARTSKITGALVAAEVVTTGEVTDLGALKTELVDHCRSRLERFQIPALIRFVKEFKLNESGKLSRKG